jgi:hypothetical protein
MEMMRATWTDERVDDLARRMDGGFDRIDNELRAMRGEIGAMQRTMIQFGGVMIAALIGLMATQLGLILTTLL